MKWCDRKICDEHVGKFKVEIQVQIVGTEMN